ncbi:rho GTPase-activating protein 12-like isoform X3 [Nerophis lumbriciformis]|uniref:rho GTPase-activating protein 12-like isoform X3 n=1 Tax=Nerophis lumbriciformis TaxID=546530 RepID=UPI002AE083DC|nr:rho GTPase-activating protein 12-like isoform X3 [Nerophis lumbriciformis]
MAELPIAPGQVYIEVEYDYEYTSKDRTISIHQGECFMLVEKSNEDWWKVRREEGTKAIYVPAQYVREVRKALMPPPKQLPHHPVSTGNTPPQSTVRVKPANLDLDIQSSSTENLNMPEANPAWPPSTHSKPGRSPSTHSKPGRSPSTHSNPGRSPSTHSNPGRSPSTHSNPGRSPSTHSNSGRSPSTHSKPGRSPSTHSASFMPSTPPIQRRDSNHHQHAPSTPTAPERALAGILVLPGGHPPIQGGNTPPLTRARSPDLVRVPLDVDSPHCDSAGEERRTNDSESGEELSSSSTEQLQAISSSGRSRPESPVYSNLQELKITQSTMPPLPSGSPLQVLGDWEMYRDQNGRHFYYNRYTQERTWKPPRARDAGMGSSRGENTSTGESTEWLKHVDDQGRPYYYNADGSRSEWELPKYNHSPSQPLGDTTKTRSLDRRPVEPIVLTNWRHSTYVQEPNDKDTPLSPKSPSSDSDSSSSSPKRPNSPSEKCGVLNMTKITENGKKVRKNWTSSWTVLQGSTLLFAKGQGGGTSWFGGGQSKPELTVDLKGSSVEWASRDKSSKKHVIELKTRQGTELLIHSENDVIVNEWYRALRDTVSSPACESDEAIEEDMPESPGAEKHDGEKENRDTMKTRAMKTSASVDGADNKKTKHKLKKFLTRRPTLQAVRDKGYIKDQVFGCSLLSLCQRENSTVPTFVRLCIDNVENESLCVDGLYRVSGNLALIQKLRYAVNHDEKVNLDDSKWEDIHVTTGALKMFFRELPEPLFTYTLFHDFVSSIKLPDYKQRVHAIKELVRQLPEPNHDTMQALFKHLRKVINHGEENRMTNQSIAIVFGPTLLRPETETWNIAVHMVYQNQIVELILLEYEKIFGK